MIKLPRKISWMEPWDWEVLKVRLRRCYKEFPPLWRMAIYCVVMPLAIMIAVRMLYPDTQETLTWSRIILLPISIFFVYCIFFPCMCALPLAVHLNEKGVFFQCGNSVSQINVNNITSLSFETRGGRRYLVVRARTKKCEPYERTALMAKKKITEEDVRRFLYEVNLAHLWVAPANGQTGEPHA